MKVRTHVKAGEFATTTALTVSGPGAPGLSLNGAGESWLEDMRLFVELEVKPWFTHIYRLEGPQDLDDKPITSRSFAKMDSLSQSLAQRWLDPLFGASRDRQRAALALGDGEPVIGPAEKTINRSLVSSLLTLGLALGGSFIYTPLLAPAFVSALYSNLTLFVQAYDDLVRERRIKSSFTYGVGLIGAWLGGFYAAAAIAGTLYFAAQKLVYKTEDQARQTLVNVFGQQIRTVWLLVDGVEVEVPLERVQAGDIVVVQAGQPIPVDGTVTRGIASIDQHTLTGEAQPVERGPGDAVLATTTVLTGAIHVRVERAGQETAAAQIADILNDTSSYQLSMESTAVRIADGLALPALLVSGLALMTVGFEGAIAVLNVNLGWNVKLTGPLAMLNYMNIISRHGVLIKDGRSLELLDGIDTIVFDKTGTLTLDQPHVADVHVFDGYSVDEMLALAATAEQRQSHPIARAILTAAQARGLALRPVDDAHYEVGFGIKVHVNGQVVRVGSARYMEIENIYVPGEVQRAQVLCGAQGHSLVLVAVDEAVRGALELHATVRPEAKHVIDRLRQRNVALYILSGDQEAPTRRLAQTLGIDHYIAGVLPEGKAAVIEQLQAEGRKVCFVGDGINDTIALKKAQVSISLRGATTIAVDAAQVVLMDQSLNRLVDVLDLGDEFRGTLREGVAWAVVPDLVLIGGVFLAGAGVYAAVAITNLGLAAGVASAMWPLLRHPDPTLPSVGQAEPELGASAPVAGQEDGAHALAVS
ncbi:MAG: heavy metal translocating P-type ATPase [Anaerolineae bacterium]|nr:heavy metal translocating P-type ATPase [Anaerolineae bacterium]